MLWSSAISLGRVREAIVLGFWAFWKNQAVLNCLGADGDESNVRLQRRIATGMSGTLNSFDGASVEGTGDCDRAQSLHMHMHFVIRIFFRFLVFCPLPLFSFTDGPSSRIYRGIINHQGSYPVLGQCRWTPFSNRPWRGLYLRDDAHAGVIHEVSFLFANVNSG